MVVIKRPLEHFDSYGYRNAGNSLIESSSVSGHVLQGRNMNSMNGILFQLSSLALTASEIFNSLNESARETFDRLNALNTRIQQINNKLPQYEQFMHENNSKLLFSTSLYELTEANLAVLYKKDHQNISKQNNPVPLNWQYTNNCLPPPEFSPLLDQIHVQLSQQAEKEAQQQAEQQQQQQGINTLPKYKTCIEAYTDSNFFFNEWAKRELERLKKAKQKRKEERKKARSERSKATATAEKKQVKQMKIHRKKYNSEGQLVESGSSQSLSRAASTRNMEIPNSSSVGSGMDEQYSPNNSSNNYMDSSNYRQPPPVPTNTNQGYGVPPPPVNNTSVPPPPINSGGYGVPPPPVKTVPPPPIGGNSGYGVPQPPPVSNNGGYSVPPPPINNNNGFSVPPPPSNVPPPPTRAINVPPPPSNNIVVSTPPPQQQSSSSGGEGNIDIMKSVEASKAQTKVMATTGKGNLLEDIRLGAKLKSVAERKLAAPKEEEKSMSVADILSKKFGNAAGDSDEEDENESDYEDDDW